MWPIPRSFLPWREVDGRVVIIHPQKGEVHELDTVGTYIWMRLTGQTSREDLAQAIVEAFDIDVEQALSDVQEFLALLESKDLIAYSK